MRGYILAQINIKDREGFSGYADKAAPVVAQYGGKFLVGTGKVETVEGERGRHRMVLIEFPSLAQARTFYDSPEYQDVLPMRFASSQTELFMAEGLGD